MVFNHGKGVLCVLDGWDELPSDLPQDSIIHKIIEPGMFQDSPLHECDIIVTSRPVSSVSLHQLVSARVEVLGFTLDELKHYFTECLNGDSTAVQSLLDRIRENPVVESSCYLPLNAAIVAHAYLSGDHTLPSSLHRIFSCVIMCSLQRYLQDRLGKTALVGSVTSLDEIPPELHTQYSHLCRLAFYGIESNKVTFTARDLVSLGIPPDICEVGLLQAVPSILSVVREVYYCFLHLSIQELLAAVHISHMSSSEQISEFQTLFGQPRFSAVFQFYAGITKLKTNRRFLSILPRFLRPVPASVYDLVQKVTRLTVKPLLISLLHCLYEAEDPSLCQFVAEQLEGKLDLSSTTLIPLDCLSVGYFLSAVSTTTSGKCRVDLYSCSISDHGCKFLTRGLCKCLNAHSTVTTQLSIILVGNTIHEEGAYHIANFIMNTSVVHKLFLPYNNIGAEGLKSLCEALVTNTSLTELYLSGCSIAVSEDNGPVLTEMLRRNNTLKVLSLSVNILTDSACQYIATGLKENTSLRQLNISYCELTDREVGAICFGLNDYLEVLHFYGNEGMSIRGLQSLASHFNTPLRLQYVVIPRHLKSCINFIFGPVNEVRMRNGLLEIDVKSKCMVIRFRMYNLCTLY